MLDWLSRSKVVYVDAEILKTHDPNLPRVAYVGYLVQGTNKQKVKRVEATETDDAEIAAIVGSAATMNAGNPTPAFSSLVHALVGVLRYLLPHPEGLPSQIDNPLVVGCDENRLTGDEVVPPQ